MLFLVGERYQKDIKEPTESQRKPTRHITIRTNKPATGNHNDSRQKRPTSLYLAKESQITNQTNRNRSKSIDNSHRRKSESKAVVFNKLKEKLLYSNPDLHENSDTESTPLVSQIQTPLTSPESKQENSTSSTSNSGFISPVAMEHDFVKISPKYVRKVKKRRDNLVDFDEISPTKSLNDEAVTDTSLNEEEPSTSGFNIPQGRSRTMSECADSAVSYLLEHSTRSLTASNVSLFSKNSQSCYHLHRQDGIDSDENIPDIYCDPETRV